MSKLVQLRVVLCVDDSIDLKDVKPRLQQSLRVKGTESIADEEQPSDATDLVERATGRQIHWGTADVLQGPERVSGRRTRGTAREVPS